MILKASERAGATRLGHHLLKTEENEHVEVHEVRGFMSETVMGAMKEADALSLGTRCKNHIFSISLNPPETKSVRVEVFEHALAMIEERLGLTGQPRVVVFHEKEGRRHCHAVFSRINADTMTAKTLPFFKNTLRDISKQLYLENGWQMPRGFLDSAARDPRNFSLDEWQQAKRAGINAKDLRGMIQECWSVSDNAATFGKALEERGLFLAKGDRRGHVAVSYQGEVFSIARVIDKTAKEVVAKLGSPDDLRSVKETVQHIGASIAPRLSRYIQEAKRVAANQMKPLIEKRHDMKVQHQLERQKMDSGQKARHDHEVKERSARFAKGFKGVWDRLNGGHAKIKKQNEMEAFFCLRRDRDQRHELTQSQRTERQGLQEQIVQTRKRETEQILALYKDAAQYRLMQSGELPNVRQSFERSAGRGSGGERGREAGKPRDRGLDLGR